MTKRYFEDIDEGEPLNCRPVPVSKEEIVRFAAEFDPQPFHVDEEAARKSVFGGLIASSLHTLSACTRAVVEAQGHVAILSGIGMDEVRMFNPVRPGDVLSVDARWIDLKKSRSKPDRGFARIRCKVANQRGEPVIEYGYQYLISCRAPLPIADELPKAAEGRHQDR
jgi:acyl dehydratase